MPVKPLNTDDFGGELFQLAMSEKARPLFEAVKTFIAEEVEPMSVEFFALDEDKEDEWSYAPGQLELLEPTAAGVAHAEDGCGVALA